MTPKRRPAQPAADSGQPVSSEIASRIRHRRAAAGLSLDQLSRLSGVSKAMLSQVERSRANPTVVVLWKIAQGLGCSLDALVGPSDASPKVEVIRGDDPRGTYLAAEGCTIRTLSPLAAEKQLEFYQITIAPKAALRSQPHFARTEEFLTVAAGAVRLAAAESTVVLKRGDSAHYRADVTHAIENAGASAAVIYLVVKYAHGRSER